MHTARLFPILISAARFLRRNSRRIASTEIESLESRLLLTTYGPLLTFPTFNQIGPVNSNSAVNWNDFAPLDPATGIRAYTGCVATAVAQIAYYWHFPSNLSFSAADAYTANPGTLSAINLNTDSVQDNFPSLPTLTAELAAIKYDGNPTEEALLSFAVGIKAQANFSSTDTVAFLMASTLNKIGFASALTSFSWVRAEPAAIADIESGKPVIISINSGSAGHTFILDGYDDSNDTFHINYGWGGVLDGWYSTAALPLPGAPGPVNIFSVVYNMQAPVAPPATNPSPPIPPAVDPPVMPPITVEPPVTPPIFVLPPPVNPDPVIPPAIDPPVAPPITVDPPVTPPVPVAPPVIPPITVDPPVTPPSPVTPPAVNPDPVIPPAIDPPVAPPITVDPPGTPAIPVSPPPGSDSPSVPTGTITQPAVTPNIKPPAAPSSSHTPASPPTVTSHATASLSAHQLYVTQLYLDLFHRPVDPAGLAYWSNQLDHGQTYSDIANAILTSREYDAIVIDNLYLAHLGRHAEPGPHGIEFWIDRMQSGLNANTIRAGILGSDEYFLRAGNTNRSFITTLYHDLLHRDPDAAALPVWLTTVATDGRAAVSDSISSSAEIRQVVITSYYEKYFHRAPDAGGLTTWTSRLAAGVDEPTIVSFFVTSPEYFSIYQIG